MSDSREIELRAELVSMGVVGIADRILKLESVAIRAAVLLNDATYHDGRYNQHTSPEWQKEACEVAKAIQRLANYSPEQEKQQVNKQVLDDVTGYA
jgi:hypothetical protein